MTKDWKLAARANGVEASDAQLDAYAQTMTAMEAQMILLKKGLSLDSEPATVFHPIHKSEDGQ